jgi:4-alpha-glucanotransferase
VENAATGAPPDSVFTTGQRWGSPPLHPVAIRERRYDYVRAYLEHHMRSARMLRVDHVMGLHHIFCIPEGAEPAMGAYLRYHPDEWYALLSLESHRNKTIIVGEDLGLVPREVRRSMARHGLSRMFVLHYEMDGLAQGRTPSISTNCLASLNTHDMPPFAAMWEGLDICQQARVGILKRGRVAAARRTRKAAIRFLLGILKTVCPQVAEGQELDVVLRCILGWLGSSRARYIMVNLEDLWLETTQQNIPGVGGAYPSWRHRAARTMEDILQGRANGNALQLLQEGIQKARRNIGGE